MKYIGLVLARPFTKLKLSVITATIFKQLRLGLTAHRRLIPYPQERRSHINTFEVVADIKDGALFWYIFNNWYRQSKGKVKEDRCSFCIHDMYYLESYPIKQKEGYVMLK